MIPDRTDPLEPISPLRPLGPAGAPGPKRRPKLHERTDQEENSEPNPDEGSETYDAEGNVHAPQHHNIDLED